LPTGRGKRRDREAASAALDEEQAPSEADIAARLRMLREQGKSGSAAARQVARELGINKSLVYQIWVSLDDRPTTNDQRPTTNDQRPTTNDE
jgi:DNA invertase Pin-like site-specific DNA recombinase